MMTGVTDEGPGRQVSDSLQVKRLKACLAEVGYAGRMEVADCFGDECSFTPDEYSAPVGHGPGVIHLSAPESVRDDPVALVAWLRALELVGFRSACWACYRTESHSQCRAGDCPQPGGRVAPPLELLRSAAC